MTSRPTWCAHPPSSGGSGQPPPRRPAPPRGFHPCPAPRASQGVQTLYLVVTTLIMGLELLTVVNATLCAILGPGLALRGPDGSMHNAVNGMMTHYKFTFACFTCGLLCFHVSALLYAWMQVLTLTAHRSPLTTHLSPFTLTRCWASRPMDCTGIRWASSRCSLRRQSFEP